MNSFYETFLSVFDVRGFSPGWFGGGDYPLGGSFNVSDVSIFLSHFGIGLCLAYCKIKSIKTQYSHLIWLFVCLMILCGLTHFMELMLYGLAWHYLSILIKNITAITSIYTGIILLRMMPKILAFPKVSATRAHLSWIIESTPDAIISCDVQGIILSWNRGAEKHLGYTAGEVRGRPLNDFISLGQNDQEVRDKIQDIMDGKLLQSHEIHCFSKIGGAKSFLVSSSKLTNEKGDIIGFCSILADLTEKKSLEQTLNEKISEFASLNSDLFLQRESLRKVNHELEYRNKELDSFTFLASHDLKSPLRAISLSADCLLTEIAHKVDPAHVKLLKLLKGRSLSMQRLLDDLLLYVKVGTSVGQAEEINTYKLVHDVIKLLHIREGYKIEVSPQLPWIISYRLPLQQIFQNLITNGLKHNHRSYGGKIKIYAKECSEYIKFSIEDNGPGIPQIYQEKIFMMFQTLKAQDNDQGSGIGLAIVKKIIDRFGGKIEVKSVMDEGSIFSFWWPKNPV